MYEKLSPGMPDDRISYILYRCTYVYIPTTEKWFLVLYILPTLFVEYHDIYIYTLTLLIGFHSEELIFRGRSGLLLMFYELLIYIKSKLMPGVEGS